MPSSGMQPADKALKILTAIMLYKTEDTISLYIIRSRRIFVISFHQIQRLSKWVLIYVI
jgi:hypothetical protein